MLDVFDKSFLQKFQDNFAKAVGVASISTEVDGTPVTDPSCFTDFCMDFNRQRSKKACARCEQCDSRGGTTAANTGRPAVYPCHVGLTDFAVPVMVDGKQVGSIIGGQVLTEPIDEAKMRQYAAEIGVDPDGYVNAARKITPVPRERIEAAANVLYLMANTLSEVAEYRKVLRGLSEEIRDTTSQVSAAMQQLAASANDTGDNQKELSEVISGIADVSSKIDEFTSLIRNIAKQTRLLGLNASIEAARAGTAGAGFAVVSEEIGKLADNSNDAVDKVLEFTTKISQAVEEAVQKGETTANIANQQAKAIEESANRLTGLAEQATKLYDLSHR